MFGIIAQSQVRDARLTVEMQPRACQTVGPRLFLVVAREEQHRLNG
jgi:hypothetical protein